MAPVRRTRLVQQLVLASAISAASVLVVCGVGLVSLQDEAREAREAVVRQIALLNDAAAFQSLFFQKGFVAEYFLTADRSWIEKLEARRADFNRWLDAAHATATDEAERNLLGEIDREYRAYDEERRRAVQIFDAGQPREANALLGQSHLHIDRLIALIGDFEHVGREGAERTLRRSQRTLRWLGVLLVSTSVAGALAAVAVGFLLARRIARPIYDLQLQVESAAQRKRIRIAEGAEGQDLEALGENVAAIIETLEATDTALVENRRRLVQSEKLSAIGELSAKLSHEILNPLAGMKAAVQLLVRSGGAAASGVASPPSIDVAETAEALDREVRRVEELVRRLVDYAKPLQPRVEVYPVAQLVDEAVEAARPAVARAGVEVVRAIAPALPPLEIDPLLMTQVLVNLLSNAAQAMAGRPGRITLSARRSSEHGRDEVCIEVADEGPGIAADDLPKLFTPFFTKRPGGHGLGLAVSQNIVLEHGGRIAAKNREHARGAVFEVWIPIVR